MSEEFSLFVHVPFTVLFSDTQRLSLLDKHRMTLVLLLPIIAKSFYSNERQRSVVRFCSSKVNEENCLIKTYK